MKSEPPFLLLTHGLLFLTFGGFISQPTCSASGREEGPCLFFLCVNSAVLVFAWEQLLTLVTGFPPLLAEDKGLKYANEESVSPYPPSQGNLHYRTVPPTSNTHSSLHHPETTLFSNS